MNDNVKQNINEKQEKTPLNQADDKSAIADEPANGKGNIAANNDSSNPSSNSHNSSQNISHEDFEALQAENRELNIKLMLAQSGAIPEQIDTLIRLWDDPEIPDNTDSNQIQSIRNEYASSFKERFAWGFANPQANTPVETDSRRIMPASKASQADIARQEAFSKGDIQKMLSMNMGKKVN